jgi:hypothetical protein
MNHFKIRGLSSAKRLAQRTDAAKAAAVLLIIALLAVVRFSMASAQSAPTDTPTAEVIMDVVTVTPQEDGRVVHIVQPGQSPWSIAIAYGIKIEELAKLNNLDPAKPIIYTGQKLLIRTIATSTAEPTGTATDIPPSSTPHPTSTRRPPTLTPTTAPTRTATTAPLIPRVDPFQDTNTRPAGIVIIVICGIGLLTVITLSLRER